MVDFRDDPSGPETLALFGSTILPLPWNLAASLDKVVLSLRRQHPAVVITFADYQTVARQAAHA
jgi:hypothetical protein